MSGWREFHPHQRNHESYTDLTQIGTRLSERTTKTSKASPMVQTEGDEGSKGDRGMSDELAECLPMNRCLASHSESVLVSSAPFVFLPRPI